MISATEALAAVADKERVHTAIDENDLTDEDRMRVDYIEATLDSIIFKNFDGKMIAVPVPVVHDGRVLATTTVVAALKQRCEAAGWNVGVFPQQQGDDVVAFQLVFSPAVVVEAGYKPALQPVARIENVSDRSRRLLVRMPTRARANKAVEVLQKYRDMAGCAITTEVVIDEDDADTLRPEILQRFAALGCVVTVGRHASKIAACNGGRVNEWDVIVIASDDMVPIEQGWAVRVLDLMDLHWPHRDGALHFNDGFQRANLCTLPVMGKRLWKQFGYVYHPDYKSLYCDREFTDLLKAMGRLTYVDEKLIEHRHHAWGRADVDALYERNDALDSVDKATYERRRAMRYPDAQWAFGSPAMWLSLLVCTTPKRRAQLEHLLGNLYGQIERSAWREVEIIVDDSEAGTVGEKRQRLLEKAHGHYVAFIDDDDGVSHEYIRRVVSALDGADADCAALEGVITTDGRNPQRFSHSMTNGSLWQTVKGVHYRGPNHLNAVRRTLALQVGFASQNIGEDHDFAQRLFPLLKKEVLTGTDPLYHYWFNSKQTVQNKP